MNNDPTVRIVLDVLGDLEVQKIRQHKYKGEPLIVAEFKAERDEYNQAEQKLIDLGFDVSLRE